MTELSYPTRDGDTPQDRTDALHEVASRRLVTLDPETRTLVATGTGLVGDVRVHVTVEAPMEGSGDTIEVSELIHVFTHISLAASRASTAAVDFLADGKLTDIEG